MGVMDIVLIIDVEWVCFIRSGAYLGENWMKDDENTSLNWLKSNFLGEYRRPARLFFPWEIGFHTSPKLCRKVAGWPEPCPVTSCGEL